MNRLTAEKRAQAIAALVEGNSIRSTCRMTGVAKNTVTKLLTDMGIACSVYMDETLRDLTCERIQADEIWAFCGMKQKNVPPDQQSDPTIGDVWTWVALDPDTKLVASYYVGGRDQQDARTFMLDLAKRLKYRIQLTTDAYNRYPAAIRHAFDGNIDYARLQKIYGADPEGQRRYSPANPVERAWRLGFVTAHVPV